MLDNPYRSNLTGDFALLFKAIASAFRGFSGDKLESHWARQRWCDENC